MLEKMLFPHIYCDEHGEDCLTSQRVLCVQSFKTTQDDALRATVSTRVSRCAQTTSIQRNSRPNVAGRWYWLNPSTTQEKTERTHPISCRLSLEAQEENKRNLPCSTRCGIQYNRHTSVTRAISPQAQQHNDDTSSLAQGTPTPRPPRSLAQPPSCFQCSKKEHLGRQPVDSLPSLQS